MPRVALTGGIGAGKSEVSRRLAARGAIVIDADAVAREVVAPGTEGLAAIVAEFGAGVLRTDGALDRERLGQIVFGDPAQLARLNAITHPLIAHRMAELERAAAADPAAIVVLDVPLLAEAKLATGLDLVIVVDATPAAQLDRLVRDRGMTREHAAARMAAQASREDRLAIAGLVIDNSGTLADLDREVERVWGELGRLAAGSSA